MKPRKIFEILLYLVLLVGGFIFVWNSLVDYMSGITTYSVQQEPLSLFDVPTIAFCIENEASVGWEDFQKSFQITVL